MPTLSIQLPGLPPVSHVLKDETITIGRMKGNNIVIEDTSISLMHAKITRKNGDFLLKDLNSTNGTIVNGQPIDEVKLRDQDRVRFADISCQFLAEAPIPVEQPGIAATAPTPVRPVMPQPVIPSAPDVTRPAVKSPQTKLAKRSLLSVLRYAGAVMAVGVVSLVIWRVVQLNKGGSSKPQTTDKATLAMSPNSLIEGKVQSVTSKQIPESSSTVSNSASASPDNEPWVPKSLAERTTEPKTQGISELIEALSSQDVVERQRAAAALHSLGAEAKEAVPALREALKDKDSDVQMWAALALVNNQEFDKSEVPVLVRVLQNDNPVLRQVACLSLGLIPYSEPEKENVVPALTDTAGKDANDDVRKAALSALSIIVPETAGKTASK